MQLGFSNYVIASLESPAKQSGRNEGILFKLWRKEILKIPNIFYIVSLATSNISQ